MILKTDTEIICLPLPEFLELSNHVSECTQNAPFQGKKSKKILTAPSSEPSPIGRGTPLPKLHPLCSSIVDDKTVTEMI